MSDEETLKQLHEIEENVRNSQPLIGPSVSVSHLLSQYRENESAGFAEGIQYLSTKYTRMRCVRGDGNCFYRALLFSYLEEIVQGLNKSQPLAKEEYDTFIGKISNSKQDLISRGYDEFIFECFYDTFIELLERLPSMSPLDLFNHFTGDDSSVADAYTWYMRLLTAGHLKANADRFFPFIEMVDYYYTDMDAFCQREVEPMGKECEHLQVTALTECLGIRVVIEYLDGRSEGGSVRNIRFPNSEEHSAGIEMHLLYRPGHYDILYDSEE